MSNHSALQSFNDLNKFFNNTNTFLLDISIPIINYLLNKNDDFLQLLKDTCRNNIRFDSCSLADGLRNESDDFLWYMVGVLGCDCCPERNPVTAEFHQDIAQRFHEYCFYLLGVLDENKFDEKLSTLPAFQADYHLTKTDLLEGRTDRASAETALLYWQGAIPDSLLQEAIVQLRYDYIRSLMKESSDSVEIQMSCLL